MMHTDLDIADVPARLAWTAQVAHRWCWVRDIKAHDAKDAEQEAHLAVAKALPSYDASRPLKPFLWACIWRRLHNWQWQRLRRQRRVTVRPVSFGGKPATISLIESLDLKYVAAAWLSKVEWQLLSKLLAGATARDLAQAQGCTPAWIHDQQRRLVRKLRDLLAQ